MQKTKLYKETETLLFDPLEHKYFWNELERPSATTITKILTPANVIGNWTSKMCAEEFKNLVRAGTTYHEHELTEFYDKIKKSANSFMSNAGAIGSQVHDLIEDYIHGKNIPTIGHEKVKLSFEKFKEWYDSQQNLELVFTERKVLSKKYGYTGTLDALFKNTKTNEYIIYDWKTSSGIRDSYYVQIYLYAICVEEEFGYKIPKGVIVNCTKEGRLKIAEFDIDSQCFDIAISCLKLYQFLTKKKRKAK
tara:strand:+ start:303 stop:1049 length:747 start_codon:yes stop_codon:yes gene_type:complete